MAGLRSCFLRGLAEQFKQNRRIGITGEQRAMISYPLQPIAYIRSPFREKFATPRQPGLTPSIRGIVEFCPGFDAHEAVRGLEEFSHIWLLFIFHHNWQEGWAPTVRPPRLGGNKRVGVFASRSPFRPNPIGLSAVKLLSINHEGGKLSLEVQGPDLIDQTPVIDVKPYIPYGDSLPDARGGFAPQAPEHQLTVKFSPPAETRIRQLEHLFPELESNIRETLRLDPRPAYRRKKPDQQTYGIAFGPFNIRWHVSGNEVTVLSIEQDVTNDRL
jgi:tRNA-Thr(GGU) m(6)t(6)A37 methyltransferase TsaA